MRVGTSWTDGEISQQQRQLYDYDINGNCSRILFQTMVEGVYADRNRATYLYDENNLCTNANAERWNDTTWVLGGFPSGTYLFFDDIYADVNNAMGSIAGCTRAEVTEYVTTPIPNNSIENNFSENPFVVYPNPANNVLFVETRRATSLPDQTYCITNLMGQTLLTGQITAEIQQIDVTNLITYI